MAQDLKLQIKINADGKAAAGEIERVERQLGKVRPSADKSAVAMAKMQSAVAGLGGALSAIAIANFSKRIAEAADNIKLLTQQAAKLSGTAEGFDQLYASAQNLGISINDAAQAVSNFSTPLAKLGRGYAQTIDFTEDLTKAMRLYGVDGQQATSVTIQMSQALNSGQLAGDELKSLSENAGPLAGLFEEAVQQITGSTASMKELGSQGQLSSEVVVRAWDRVFEQLRDDMESLPDALEQQENRMANAAERLMAAIDSKVHASDFWGLVTGRFTAGLERISSYLEGDLAPGLYASERDRFNELVGLAQTLSDEYAEQVAVLERLSASDRTRQQTLAGQREAVLRTAQALGDVRAELEAMQQQPPELPTVEVESIDHWTRAMVSATAETLNWSSGIASATSRLEQSGPIVRAAAEKYKIPEEVVLSVFAMENAFGRLNESTAGAKGPMQFMDDTAAGVAAQMNAAGVSTGMTAAKIQGELTPAIEAGAFHLADLLGQFGSFHDALIAYNAGPGNVGLKFVDLPEETQNYLRNGIKLIGEYADATGNAGKFSRELAAAHAYMAGELEGSAAAIKKASRGVTEHQREQIAIARTMANLRADATRSVERLIDQYLPAESAARKLAEAQAALALAGEAAGLSHEQQATILEQYRADLTKTAETATAATDALGREVQTIGELMLQSAKTAVDSIQREIGDGIGDMLAKMNGTTRAEMDTWQRIILDTVADLAAQLITQKLVVPIVAQVIGVGQGASAGAGSFGGLTGDPNTNIFGLASSGSNLISGGGSLATAAGFASNFGASMLGGSGVGQAAMLAGQTGAFGAAGASATASALGASGAASGMAGVMGVIGAAAPYVAAVAAIASATGLLDGLFGDDEHQQLRAMITDGRIHITHAQDMPSESFNKVQDAMDAINEGLLATAQELGPAAMEGLMNFQHQEMPLPPEDGAEIERILNEKADAMVRAMIDAMADASAGELGASYAELVRSVQQAADGDLEQFLSGMAALDQSLTALGSSFAAIWPQIDTGLNNTAAAVAAFAERGINAQDALALSTQYLSDYYTEAEREQRQLADATAAYTATFGDLNIAIPSSKAELRDLIDGMIATEGSITQTIAALLEIAPAFATVADAAEASAARMQSAFASLAAGSGSSSPDLAALAAPWNNAIGEFVDITQFARENIVDWINSWQPLGDRDTPVEEFNNWLQYNGFGDAETLIAAADAYFDALESIQPAGQPAAPTAGTTGASGYTPPSDTGPTALEQLQQAFPPVLDEIAAATTLFEILGLTLPASSDALAELIHSGTLTAEQTTALAADLGLVSGAMQQLDADAQAAAQALADAQSDVQRIYQDVFDRSADDAGIAYWTERWLSGELESIDDLTQQMLGGASLGDATGIIERLYRDVLGRYADPAGLDYWVSQLQTGLLTLEQIGDAMQVGAQQRQLEIDLMRALGDEQGALNAEREIELLTLPKSQRALKQYIWDLQDASTAAESAIETLRSAVDAMKDNLTSAFDALERSIQAQINDEGIQDRIDHLKGLSDSLADAIERFRAPQPALDISARSELSTMAILARTAGIMPDTDRLERVLGDLLEPAAADYSTEIDLLRERAQIQSDLSDLATTTDDALSVEEKTLRTLETQLEDARLRYNKLMGIDETLLSVDEAFARFKTAAEEADAALLKAGVDTIDAIVTAYQSQYNALIGIDDSVQSVEAATNAVAAAISALAGLINQPPPAVPAPSAPVNTGPIVSPNPVTGPGSPVLSPVASLYESMLGRAADPAGLAYWEGRAASSSMSSIIDDFRAGAIAAGEIPRFAAGGLHTGGLRLVGERGPELEITGPSRIVPTNAIGGLLDTSALEAELRELRREVAQQRQELQRYHHLSLKEQQKSADLLERQEKLGPKPTRATV